MARPGLAERLPYRYFQVWQATLLAGRTHYLAVPEQQRHADQANQGNHKVPEVTPQRTCLDCFRQERGTAQQSRKNAAETDGCHKHAGTQVAPEVLPVEERRQKEAAQAA